MLSSRCVLGLILLLMHMLVYIVSSADVNLTAIKIFQALFINVTMSDPRYRHGAEHRTHAANDDGEEGSRTCTTQHCSNHL